MSHRIRSFYTFAATFALVTIAVLLFAGRTSAAPATDPAPGAAAKDGMIAFFSWYGHADFFAPLDLMVLDPKGGKPKVLVPGAVNRSTCGFGLSWSPDGNQIAYVSGAGLWIVDAEGTNNHKVANVCAGAIDWSPNGEWLVMDMGSAVGLVHPNGKGFRFLDPGNKDLYGYGPTFSADGKVVAMVGTGSDTPLVGWGVYGFDVNDGSFVARYADTNLRGQTSGLDSIPKNLDWRPDGKAILLGFDDYRGQSACAPLGQDQQYPDPNLWTVAAKPDSTPVRIGSTTKQFNTLRERQGTWSPSGTKIAFTATRALKCADDGSETFVPGEGIYTMNADGTKPTLLFQDPGPVVYGAVDLDWQPCNSKTRTCEVKTGKCRGQAATIFGTTGPDTLTGTPGDDVISAFTGNDKIDAGGGNDLICAGPGDDRVKGGDGDDTVHGDAGKDTIGGDAGADRVNGGSGDDRVDGDDDDDNLTGGGGNDTIGGGDGADRLFGIGGDDRISGGDGDDRASGGAGLDRVAGGTGNDRLVGGGDNDTVNGDSGNDTLFGRAADDDIDGGSGDDSIFAGGGDDDANGATGNDRVNGEDGDDAVEGGDGTDTVHGNSGDDTLSGGAGAGDVCDGDLGVDALAAAHGCESVVAVP